MQFDKFIEKYFDPNDDTGFKEMIFQRQAKLKTLRERLKQYYLTEQELDKLFEIIIKAEMEMEKIKRGFKQKNQTLEGSVEEMYKFKKKLYAVQEKMKKDFEAKLQKIIKAKYEHAKKIHEQRKKQNPDM